jgi:hypothetical protein
MTIAASAAELSPPLGADIVREGRERNRKVGRFFFNNKNRFFFETRNSLLTYHLVKEKSSQIQFSTPTLLFTRPELVS